MLGGSGLLSESDSLPCCLFSLSLCSFVAFVSLDFLSVLQRPSSFVLKWQRQRRTETRFYLSRTDGGANTGKKGRKTKTIIVQR